MSAQYDRGVSVLPTWHRQEEIVSMSSGDELVAHMLRVGALPTSVAEEALWTSHGLRVASTHRAIVASYQGHPDRVVGVVRGRYQAVDPSEFKALVTAACYAGAVPDGGFALDVHSENQRERRGAAASPRFGVNPRLEHICYYWCMR